MARRLHFRDPREIRRDLGRFPREEARGTEDRLRAATGAGHALSEYELDSHVLTATLEVMKGRERDSDDLLAAAIKRVNRSESSVVLVDDDEMIRACSFKAALLLGFRPDELIGRSQEQVRAEGQDWEELNARLRRDRHQEGIVLVRTADDGPVAIAYTAEALRCGWHEVYLVHTRPAPASEYRDVTGALLGRTGDGGEVRWLGRARGVELELIGA